MGGDAGAHHRHDVEGPGAGRRPSRAGAPLPAERFADAAGATIALLLTGWVGLGAGEGAGRPTPPVLLLVTGIALVAVARRLTARAPGIVEGGVALGILASLLLTLPGVLRAGGGPLGYANANATLAGLAALTAGGLAHTTRHSSARRAWWASALVATVAVVGTRSVAGGTCLAVAAGLLVLSIVHRRPATAVLGGAIAVTLALGLTVAVARGADPLGTREREPERAQLWQAAADLAATNPLWGIGPGRFEEESPVSADTDLLWAHHDYLQLGAETGIVGLGLLLALVGWAYARLGLATLRSPLRASIGASLLTLVALHAAVDHVGHSAAVPLSLAALLGAVTDPRCPTVRGSRG